MRRTFSFLWGLVTLPWRVDLILLMIALLVAFGSSWFQTDEDHALRIASTTENNTVLTRHEWADATEAERMIALQYGRCAYNAARLIPDATSRIMRIYGDIQEFRDLICWRNPTETIAILDYVTTNESWAANAQATFGQTTASLADLVSEGTLALWNGEFSLEDAKMPDIDWVSLNPYERGERVIELMIDQKHAFFLRYVVFENEDGEVVADVLPFQTTIQVGTQLLIGATLRTERKWYSGEDLTMVDLLMPAAEAAFIIGAGMWAKHVLAGGSKAAAAVTIGAKKTSLSAKVTGFIKLAKPALSSKMLVRAAWIAGAYMVVFERDLVWSGVYVIAESMGFNGWWAVVIAKALFWYVFYRIVCMILIPIVTSARFMIWMGWLGVKGTRAVANAVA